VSSNESAPAATPIVETQLATTEQPAELGAKAPINPNEPPWRVPAAFLTWGISVLLLLIVPLLLTLPYLLYRALSQGSVEGLGNDPNLIFISILGILPAHGLTFLVVRQLVTKNGRLPFWETLGWSWPENFGPWKSIGLAVVLLVAGLLATSYLGGSETQLDQVIKSSLKARFATAFLAVVTAPLVEELIYRGVLYAPLQRTLGVLWAVVVVSAFFTGVHVVQYYNNFGVVAVIAVFSISLTLVRAFTGRLLPSYVMHVVFNGIQALYLLLQPLIEKSASEQKTAAALIVQSLSRLLP
jgi:membrane protease YdiL (CAAX protease family)